MTEKFFKGKNLYLHEDYVYNDTRRRITRVEANEAVADWSLLYDAEHYKKEYRIRNEQIIKYFAGRQDQLLVIDLTVESDTSKICRFLDLPMHLTMDVPHENKT